MPQIITGFDRYAQDARANKTLKLNEELARSGEVRAQAQDAREATRLGLDQARAMREVTQFDRIEAEAAAGADLRKKMQEAGYAATTHELGQKEWAGLMVAGTLPVSGFEYQGRLMLGDKFDQFASGDVSLVKGKDGQFTNITFDNGQGVVETRAINDPRFLETMGKNAGTLVAGPRGLVNGVETLTVFDNDTGKTQVITGTGTAPGATEKPDSFTPEQVAKTIQPEFDSRLNKLVNALPQEVIQYLPQGKTATPDIITRAIVEAKAAAKAQWEKNGQYGGPFDTTPYDNASAAIQDLLDWRVSENKRLTGSQINGNGAPARNTAGGAGGYNPGMIGGGGSGGTAPATGGASVSW